MTGRIWLGTQGSEQLLSAESRIYNEEPFEIVREGRTVSGKLVQDVIAEKIKFTLTYELITGTVLAQLKALYLLGKTATLHIKVEQKDDSIVEYDVVFRPFARSRYLTSGDWLWADITVELEEI